MLIYLLGDVLRIFAGEFTAGEISGKKVHKLAYLGISMLMLIPILMAVSTLILPVQAARVSSIGLSGFFFLFNLVGIPTYPSAYDRFLLVVSLVFNVMTIYYAWNWVA
jgi:hypothetical protein